MLKIIKAIGKSIWWNTLYVVAGLSQLLFLCLITRYSNTPLDFDKILKDGVILFFCSAFVAGSVIEYFFVSIRYPKVFEGLFFYAAPGLIIVFVVATYCGIIGFQDDVDINMTMLKQGTYVCFLASICHALVSRTLHFLSQEV